MPGSHNDRNDGPPIAVVEDDAPLLEAIRFALEMEGWRVRAFANGEALLAAESLDEVGCFVVDHRLGGIDGLEAIDMLRARGVTAPSVLITTAPDEALRKACRRMDVLLVEKPLLGDSLSIGVRRRLVTRSALPKDSNTNT